MIDPTVAPPSAAYADDWRLDRTQQPARPRATSDYSQIATEHHIVPLGGIGRSPAATTIPVRRFIALVDELHDRHVNLICTDPAAPPLYTGAKLAGAFARTASRLIQRQSAGYLAREHRGQAQRCDESTPGSVARPLRHRLGPGSLPTSPKTRPLP